MSRLYSYITQNCTKTRQSSVGFYNYVTLISSEVKNDIIIELLNCVFVCFSYQMQLLKGKVS